MCKLYVNVVVCAILSLGTIHSQNSKRIVGYVMGSRIDQSEQRIQVEKLTHINYAFADLVDGEVVEIHKEDVENMQYLNSLKIHNEDLKLLISIGGWSRSGGFSDAVFTAESREKFASSAIAFLQRHHLDGIDLDWEYPGQAGSGNTFRPEDKQNFTAALQLLRKKLDSLAALDGRSYLLTIASAAGQRYLDNVEMDKISELLDFINVMTYDYFGAWSTTTGNHSQLIPNGDDAVKQHLAAGVPPEKLTLGVAFYGRGWKNVEGLREEASKEAFSISYDQINASLKQGYTEIWDSISMSPYAWNESSGTLIGYDNSRSLIMKSKYVRDRGLGGIMFWEYHGDHEGELLGSVYSALNTIPAHAHNDYENERPLEVALKLGFKSIEVDVHLIEDELYVSHNKPRQLEPSKTLEAMYLKPLSQVEFVQSPLFLLIDVKSSAKETYKVLAEKLSEYQNSNIKYIISGNRAFENIIAEDPRLMHIDGRPDDLKREISSDIMPLISQNYKKFFSSRDPSNIDLKEKEAFAHFVSTAHAQGKMVRLWASPDQEETWKFLQEMGVDLINTDDLYGLSQFLSLPTR